jgi:abhydrolase domain-containing protein 13
VPALCDSAGYGKSEGHPSEQGLLLDAEAFIRVLRENPDLNIDAKQIILFGRSLGGAVAIAAADEFSEHVKAVIVENTFLSISYMVDSLMPALRYFKPLVLRVSTADHSTLRTLA